MKVDITDSSGQAQNPLYRDNPFYRKSDIADSENVRYNGFYLLLDICYISLSMYTVKAYSSIIKNKKLIKIRLH